MYYPLVPVKQRKGKKNDKALSGVSNTDIEKCVFGSLHQGSETFSERSRGRQCVSNAVVSILYKYVNEREIKEWSSEDIDFILRCGDEVYQCVRQYCTHTYLQPKDLPSYFCFEKKLLRCSVSSTFSGNLCESFVQIGPFLSLESAMASCFYGITEAGIFICRGAAVSILYSDPYFHVFDPHARDSSGKPNSDGNAVIFTVNTFSCVNKLIRQIFDCQESVQFDLCQINGFIMQDRAHFARQKNAVCLSKVKKNLFDLCDICGHSDFEQMQHPIEHAIEHNKTDVALIAKFHKSILSGPDYVCRCCTQTWFKESVLKASNISASMLQKCLIKKDDLVCRTCYQHLKENRIPPCSIMNSLGFPPKPSELE